MPRETMGGTSTGCSACETVAQVYLVTPYPDSGVILFLLARRALSWSRVEVLAGCPCDSDRKSFLV